MPEQEVNVPNGEGRSLPAISRGFAKRGRPPAARDERIAPPAEHRVEAVERALTLLEAFADDGSALSLAALARRSNLNPSTILRLSSSLARFGYIHRNENGLFRLGPKPLQLGLRYRESFALADYVRPALARLSQDTCETASFYVREGSHRICLFRHEVSRPIRHHVEEGGRLPLDKGASAHVLVAFGDKGEEPRHAAVRACGYAISFGERDPESAAVAAPVFGPDEHLIGAVGIVGLLTRLRGADPDALARTVRAEAARITSSLGGSR